MWSKILKIINKLHLKNIFITWSGQIDQCYTEMEERSTKHIFIPSDKWLSEIKQQRNVNWSAISTPAQHHLNPTTEQCPAKYLKYQNIRDISEVMGIDTPLLCSHFWENIISFLQERRDYNTLQWYCVPSSSFCIQNLRMLLNLVKRHSPKIQIKLWTHFWLVKQ